MAKSLFFSRTAVHRNQKKEKQKMNKDIINNKIRELIAKDKLKEAIELLRNNAKTNDLLNDVIMQSAKYNEVKNLIRKDIISFEQANISKAKIRNALLDLVGELENSKQQGNKSKTLVKKIVLFFSSLVLVALTIFWIEPKFQNSSTENKVKVAFEEGKVKNEKNESKTLDETKSVESTEVTLPKQDQEPKSKKDKVVEIPKNKERIFPTIEGQVLDNNDKGIANALIVTSDGSEVKTNKLGLFRLTLKKSIEEYPSKIYLYYSKDSLESKSLIRVGQKNVILKF
jgi:hypothetical protein